MLGSAQLLLSILGPQILARCDAHLEVFCSQLNLSRNAFTDTKMCLLGDSKPGQIKMKMNYLLELLFYCRDKTS